MLVLLIFVSIGAFALVSMTPLDPLQTNVGQAALGSMSPEQIERLRLYWGEGIPPLKRYLAWAGDFACGNMGTSLLYHQPVEKVIQIRFASSVWLMAAAWILSGVAGVILGMAAGARKGSLADRVISAYALVTASTPAFWVALVLLMVFAVWLKVLPVGLSVPIGADAAAVSIADRIRHGILPAAALSLTGISNITLHTREKDDTGHGKRLCAFCKGQRRKPGFYCFQTWASQYDPSGINTAVRFDQRDFWRFCSCGTGIFLSGAGTGGSKRRSWK